MRRASSTLYDLVVRGGTLVDPAQQINDKMDIAILNEKVEAIESRISESNAKRAIDASGMIVTPGLVDIHTHTAHNVVRLSIDPEQACLLRGSTTVVDAGSTGELIYNPFKKFVIERSRCRVLAFLNIESLGMIEFADIQPDNTDQGWPKLLTAQNEIYVPLFVNLEKTINTIRNNRDNIVGIKWAHHGLKGMSLAREAADMASCTLMIECHHMPEALRHVNKGDIITHCFYYDVNPVSGRYDGMTEDARKIRPEFFDAVKRGVLLDVGHGQRSFSWKVAELAIKEGLKPNTISTDLWVGNINGPVYDLPTTMAKFLLLGMSLEEVVEATTANPASAIGKLGGVGTLRPGSCGDIAVFKLQYGKFPLIDSYSEKRMGEQMLVPTRVVRNGDIILDGSGS